MNTSLLAINNMFVRPVSAWQTPSINSVSANITPFSLTSAINSGLPNTSERLTVDSNLTKDSQNDKGKVRRFKSILNNEITIQGTYKNQDKAKPKVQSESSVAIRGDKQEKTALDKELLTANALINQRIVSDITQSPVELNGTKLTFNLAQMVSCQNLDQKMTSSTNCVLPKLNIYDNISGMGENSKLQTSNKEAVISPNHQHRANIQKLESVVQSVEFRKRIVISDNNAASTGDKIKDSEAIAQSSGQKTGKLNHNLKLIQENLPVDKKETFDSPIKYGVIGEKTKISESMAKSQHNKLADIKVFPEVQNENSKKTSDNLSAKSLIQKLDATMLTRPSSQTKGGGSLTLDNRCESASVQQPVLGMEFGKLITTSQTENTTNPSIQTSHGGFLGNINEQIAESIYVGLGQGERYITIQLNPPELGKIFVRLEQHEDEITGLLEVSKAQTKYEIEQVLDQLMRSLTNFGVQVKRLEVQMSNHFEQQPDRNLAGGDLQDSSFQQQHHHEESVADHNSVSEGMTEEVKNSFQDIAEPRPIVSDGSINVLL